MWPAGGTRKISTGRWRPTSGWRESTRRISIFWQRGRGIMAAGGTGPGKSLGEIPFGSDTAVYFRRNIEAPWFAYWLKDKGKLPLKEAILFQTGSNEWVKYDSWPPREAQTRNIYMREDGALSFTEPPASSAANSAETKAVAIDFDVYISD